MLYEHIARLASGPWNSGGQLGLVVGATFPGEIARVRELAPTLPLLIPGIGAQGGDAEATVRAGWRAGRTDHRQLLARHPLCLGRRGLRRGRPPRGAGDTLAAERGTRRELIPPGGENEAALAPPWRQTCRLAQDVGEDPTGHEARTVPITPCVDRRRRRAARGTAPDHAALLRHRRGRGIAGCAGVRVPARRHGARGTLAAGAGFLRTGCSGCHVDARRRHAHGRPCGAWWSSSPSA